MKPVNEFMQEKFLREQGTERQQHNSHPLDSERDKILPLLKKMGLHSRVEPDAQKYVGITLYHERPFRFIVMGNISFFGWKYKPQILHDVSDLKIQASFILKLNNDYV